MGRDFGTRQRGSALIISLVILMVMSLLGLSSIQSSALEEKMAGNLRDRNLAFQAAESALRAGEAWVRNPPEASRDSAGLPRSGLFLCPADGDTNGLYRPNCGGSPIWEALADSAWTAAASTVQYTGTLASVTTDPAYIVEELERGCIPSQVPGEPCNEVGVYRITAQGTGGSGGRIMLQTTFFRNPSRESSP